MPFAEKRVNKWDAYFQSLKESTSHAMHPRTYQKTAYSTELSAEFS